MARISLVQMEDASPEVKEIYEQKLKGKPGNAQKVMAHRPDMLKSFLGFYPTVGRSLERRLVQLRVLRLCSFSVSFPAGFVLAKVRQAGSTVPLNSVGH